VLKSLSTWLILRGILAVIVGILLLGLIDIGAGVVALVLVLVVAFWALFGGFSEVFTRGIDVRRTERALHTGKRLAGSLNPKPSQAMT
jgi:Zn-dependent membrane protease YugP